MLLGYYSIQTLFVFTLLKIKILNNDMLGAFPTERLTISSKFNGALVVLIQDVVVHNISLCRKEISFP